MLVLGVESSCDETGFALYDSTRGLLAHTLHSQIDLHAAYGGVVPELASRDHIQRTVPLLNAVLQQARIAPTAIDAVAYTQGPGLAGALLVGATFAHALAMGLGKPVIGVHHLEGHLLSPLLSGTPPCFPFVALLVSGGHTQLMLVEHVGAYTLLGETLDDAAGEAFDKTAKLLGLPYPGGAALSQLALQGDAQLSAARFPLPRPMLHSGNFEMSFSGLKTAVLMHTRAAHFSENDKPHLARAFVDAVVDVLSAKAWAALKQTQCARLVVAGGVGANAQLRTRLAQLAQKNQFELFFPEMEFCTDNGAMIALAGALRLTAGASQARFDYGFGVLPRWGLASFEIAIAR